MDRRQFTFVAAGALAGIVLTPRLGIAQEASPGVESSLLDGLGLPVMDVVVTDEGVSGPSDIAAGPVLLMAHNETANALTVDVTQLPEGISPAEYLAIGAEGEFGVPAWAADLVMAGYASVPPMGSGSIVLNLAPGDWTLIADSVEAMAAPSAPLTVTGTAPTDVSIAAAFDLEYGEYTFNLPESIPGGPQIWHVTNVHTVPHHAIIFPVDQPYTADEVHMGIMAAFGGTPAAEGFSMDTSIAGPPIDLPVISAGQEFWQTVTLMPGFYVALCFIADPGGDVPHLMQGMIATFEAT